MNNNKVITKFYAEKFIEELDRKFPEGNSAINLIKDTLNQAADDWDNGIRDIKFTEVSSSHTTINFYISKFISELDKKFTNVESADFLKSRLQSISN